jgi:hypothetical protein
MKSRVLIDFAAILLIYGIYGVITVLVYGQDQFTGENGSDVAYLPLAMIGISLFCALIWYAMGAWGIKPTAPPLQWIAVWVLLLAVVAISAATITMMEGARMHNDTNADSNPWLHFCGGMGFFYLATMLFSPTACKFFIWPSKLIRTW